MRTYTYILIYILLLLFGGYFDKILFRISINTSEHFHGGGARGLYAVVQHNIARCLPGRSFHYLSLSLALCRYVEAIASLSLFFPLRLYKTLLCSG